MALILIVEDNLANMKLATLLLVRAGHTVLTAADAETGLTLARANGPDLVLMDVQLPGMDGLAATVLLKGDPTTAAIPIIALTAMAMQADREKSRVAGCDAYITKPLRYKELYEVIDSLLAPGRAGAAPETPSPVVPPEAGEMPHFGAGEPGPAVDVRILEGLVGDDPVVIRELFGDFRTSAIAIAEELAAACENGEPARAGEQAHKLKSSARAVGALALGELCAAMETAGRSHSTHELATLLPLFEQELGAVNAFLDSLPPGHRLP
ncbi:response regulator [Cryobacterium tagatosivorans]|uniref:Response regulator n=1 Tax=Cryobacterium tagatosivorans TaxID=1259199 RepID=A0A4R8UE57_9MICO|nr:response regulator [Cryobacterium tagatosivorans]TFB49881.1 response regulator [Cryobacterium tagatosivorans]